MAAEPTDSYKPAMDRVTALHPDVIAANEALTLSLIRQHEITEAAELVNAQLQAEIVVPGRSCLYYVRGRTHYSSCRGPPHHGDIPIWRGIAIRDDPAQFKLGHYRSLVWIE